MYIKKNSLYKKKINIYYIKVQIHIWCGARRDRVGQAKLIPTSLPFQGGKTHVEKSGVRQVK